MTIYYDTRTNNVKRFVEKVKHLRPEWDIRYIDERDETSLHRVVYPIHLITYTTKFGEVPDNTSIFINKIGMKNIATVASSGNRNWGANFALAAVKIAKLTSPNLPYLQFELNGIEENVKAYIKMVEDNASMRQLHQYP